MKLAYKIDRYLRTRKTPVSVQQLSTRFAVTQGAVRSALRLIPTKVSTIGTTKYYSFDATESQDAR